jgi:CubicO group peptidase (beta-lactamase class C family)
MTEPARQHLSDLRLFTGAPQHEHFCRMNELVATRSMAPSATPRTWATGAPVDLPATFEFMGSTLSADELLAQTDTAALLVVQDGVIRHERYTLTGGPHVNWLSMSVAKSFISALVGIALSEGLIGDVEEPVSKYVPVEPGTAYDGTAIRSVLQMSSGARWNEDYHDPESDVARMGAATSGIGGTSHATVVATMPREYPPDTVCRYNSADTQALAMLLRHATGQSIAEYMRAKLGEPLGFGDPGYWVIDPAGIEMGYAGLNLTARDYAAFGELYRNGGAWQGRQLVPADWVRVSTRSTAAHTDFGQPVLAGMRLPQGYGYQWWLPAGDRGDFMAIGVYNQYVYVDPASAVTIVKLSANRFYGTAADMSTNRDGECMEYLAAIARSLG